MPNLKLEQYGKLILTAERVIGKIKKENKNKMVNYICLIFWFATQTFNGDFKSKMNIHCRYKINVTYVTLF